MEVAMPHPVSKNGSADKFKQGLDELNRLGRPKNESERARRNAVEGETSHHGLPMLHSKSRGKPKKQDEEINRSAAKAPRRSPRDA
jgi:hypothetical protein